MIKIPQLVFKRSLSIQRNRVPFRSNFVGGIFTPQRLTHNIAVPENLKRGKDREPLNLVVGDKLHGFEVKEVTHVPERQLTCYVFNHIKTGAVWLHADCEDTNNAFCVTFKTTPKDSTGVAHILEHTTLCGSQKYPVRDPFFNMLKRSLNTFMNAWTAPDYTSYPFATQNYKDFYNLLSVYTDATFFPLLEEIDFRQEGHRLEFEEIENRESPLKIKGVVYNEMKGSLSDNSTLFCERLVQNLYPTTTYQYNSGGDPEFIPNLSYSQLKDFHKKHYHPSNAWFLSYGDLSPQNHLKFLEENALSKFSSIVPNTSVGNEVRWSEPKIIQETCPPSGLGSTSLEQQTKITVALLLNNISDHFENFSLYLLSLLLTRGPNSPFYQNLVEDGLGLDYSPDTGYSSGFREAHFSVGLTGVKEEDVETVKERIMETLQTVAEEGFDPERIESILHQVEISQKTVTSDFGMQLAGRLHSSWIHGGNPVKTLQYNQTIERLRKEMSSGPFFQNLIKKYLLNNPHKLTFIMRPDESYPSKLKEKEEEKIKQIKSTLNQEEINKIIEQAKKLKLRQEEKQNIDLLPTLTISDIPRMGIHTPIIYKTINNSEVQFLDQPTNGITYFRAIFDISTVPPSLQEYVPLLCSVLTEMSAGEMDHRELSQKIETYTGGLSISPFVSNNHSNLDILEGGAFFHGSCLNRNLENMFSLIETVVLDHKFNDLDLLKVLLSGRMSQLLESVVDSGTRYASSFSAAGLSDVHYRKELWGGLTQVQFMKKIAQDDNLLSDISSKISRLAKFILKRNLLKFSIVTERQNFERVEKSIEKFLNQFPSNELKLDGKKEDIPYINCTKKTLFVVPSASVNDVSQVIKTVPYTHPDSVYLQLLGRVLSACYLHTEIREKGGAYGSGANYGKGLFSFYSYRDPSPLNSLDVFGHARDWVNKAGNIKDQDIEEAKLYLFSDFDSPLAPYEKGLSEFKHNITFEMRQKRRELLLDAKKTHVQEVAEKYLLQPSESPIAVVGGIEFSNLIGKNEGWEIRNH